jgi:type I restriction enzyme, R subunit
MGEELEWKTRRDRIDKRLTELRPAWKIMPFIAGMDTGSLHSVAVTEYPTSSGPADYALFVNGKLLAYLEAKKVRVGSQNVLEQAKRYSRTSYEVLGNWRGYHVPFLYSTHGERVFFIDIRTEKNLSREIANFHTADALAELLTRDVDFEWFAENPISNERLRGYQRQAIEKTEEAFARGERSMLLAMATGTGKTFTTVSQIYRLLESKQFRRILFLVDRRALAVQAVREFASFSTPKGNKFVQEYEVYHQRFRREDYDDDRPFDPKVLPEDYLTRPQPSKTFVYVSTIQRMTMRERSPLREAIGRS